MGWKSTVTAAAAPHVAEAAPGLTHAFVRESLHRAIHGVGPLPGAAAAADAQLVEQHGDVDRAIHEVIENHVRMAGANGFLTNLGGLVTAAVLIPANIIGLTVIQARMVAGIAHLRGYDLADPRVDNAILGCMIGEDSVTRLVNEKRLPATPMAMATAPVHDPSLNRLVSAEVAAEIVGKIAGRRVAMSVGRRVPLLGGVVGLGIDGFFTWRIGRYTDRELLPRGPR